LERAQKWTGSLLEARGESLVTSASCGGGPRRPPAPSWADMKGMTSGMPASRAMKGVQNMAKGVGDAFTGGRDLHQLLHALHSTTVAVEAYFNQPCFVRVLPKDLCMWAHSLCGEAREAHGRLRSVPARSLPARRKTGGAMPSLTCDAIPQSTDRAHGEGWRAGGGGVNAARNVFGCRSFTHPGGGNGVVSD